MAKYANDYTEGRELTEPQMNTFTELHEKQMSDIGEMNVKQ